MPLVVEIIREGLHVKPPWGWTEQTLDVILTAALKEGDPDLEYKEGETFGNIPVGQYVNVSITGVYYIDTKAPLWKLGRQVLREDFVVADFALRAGDEIKMWRS